MIQNILTFCVKNDLTFVDGSLPSGKLVANDINRNSIYLITPYFEATVFANFQSNLQADKPTSVIGVLVNGKIDISEVVDPSKSYYDLVKNWNIYEFKVPSYTLAFISRNRTGKIGINFSIEQRLVPMIKPSYGDYLGEATRDTPFPTQSGYYIVKDPLFEFDDGISLNYGINDLFIYDVVLDKQTKINAYTNRGSTPTALYSVDPSILNDNYEVIQPSLTTQISQQVNENSSNINLLFTNIGTNNATLISLENRLSQAEQDIDTAESNITNLQGRMNIAESDIENIEDGTTIVGKALKDSLGNIIKDSYVSSVYPTYNDITDKLFVETYDVQDGLLANNEVVLPKATTTKNGLMSKEDKAYVDGLPSALLLKENKSEKGIANGYASLDGGAKIPTSQLPDSILGQLEYKGTFNPSSGYPISPEKGWFYIAIANALISGVDYKVGDWAVYNGSTWDKVDNTDAVASVNGKLGAVILYGNEIQVGNGDTWTVEQRIVNIYAELNNRYTKAQTYTNAEVEQRITDLLGLANLQDTAIEKSAGVFTFDNGDSLLASSLSQYNWVITRFYNVDGGVQNVRYNLFKPSEAIIGNRTIVQIDRSPVRYAEIKRDNGNILFRVVDESDTFDSGYVCTMKMWGIKLDGINATEVDYDNSTSGLVADKVQGAIDEVVVELNTLENKVDLTNIKQDIRINEIEELARKSASGETSDNVLGTDIIPLNKNTANAPMSVEVDGGILEAPNLVVNGDFSIDTNSDNIPDGFVLNLATANSLVSGVFTFTPTASTGRFQQLLNYNLGDTIYYFANVKADSNLVNLSNNYDTIGSHSGGNEFEFLSGVRTMTEPVKVISIRSTATASFTPISVDYIGAFNISQMKLNGVKNDNGVPFTLLTNGQIKTQLDLWISKGIIPNDNLLSVNMNKRVRSVGKNLFDKSTVVIGKYISASNTVVTDASFSYSDFISVKPSTQYIKDVGGDNLFYDINKNLILYTVGSAFTTPSNCYYVRLNRAISGLNTFQLEQGTVATAYTPYVHSDLYLQANTKGYSLPNGVKDTIEYRNGKYYFVKRVDDTDLNNLVELSPYVETEIEAWGNLQGYESGIVYVDDIKIDASIYNSGITTTSEIKALDEIVKITNGVETQIDTSLAVIAVDKLSFTHPDLVDGDYVWFAYEENGNYYKATTKITYYIDKLVRTSPDGSVWKLDWSVSNAGVITWTPTKI